MKSEAVSESLDILAARYRVTDPTVLAAATAAMLSAVTGNSNVLLKTVSNNRFSADLKDMLGIALGNSLIAIPVGERSLEDVIRHVGKTAVAAVIHAQCDPVELYRHVARRNHERGVCTDLFEAFINDRRYFSSLSSDEELSCTELRELAERTTVYPDGGWQRQNAKFFLDAGPDAAGGEDVFRIMADTAFLSTAEITQLLHGLESLLITGSVARCRARKSRTSSAWPGPNGANPGSSSTSAGLMWTGPPKSCGRSPAARKPPFSPSIPGPERSWWRTSGVRIPW
ncbi:condensation domain-containing protein [Streptomyces pinistramenti]|uniref:condensation domain-containing protein n=1 Tax=Streptomyces pinistramenti TaxID=2884812 RepID=UPI001D07BD42|nr:condensation domain-containing protein [Streptomyces pinistramenti]MCB5906577.1 condensation domain-containing protein [Streptomyces pinistramenti]